MISVMVVDDEPLARQRMQRLLESVGEVAAVTEAENGEQALGRYAEAPVDVVLLDIEMPGINGLAVAQQLTARHTSAEQPAPAVIFCTAYDEHAIAAFEAQAVAYLLKPVTLDKLRQALVRASRLNRAQLNALDATAIAERNSVDGREFCARSAAGMQRLPFSQVRYFHADNKYVSAVHTGGELILDDSLKELEDQLGAAVQRVHRNALVVWAQVTGMRRSAAGRYRVVLRDVDQGPVISRRHLSAFKARLGQSGQGSGD